MAAFCYLTAAQVLSCAALLLVVSAGRAESDGSAENAESAPRTAFIPKVMSTKVAQEARQRFDLGLQAYNRGDYDGALAEFQRAYELSAHPIVRFNIGLVEARRGAPVESLDALEPLLEQAEALGPTRHQRASETVVAQRRRVGSISLESNAPGLLLSVDGRPAEWASGRALRLKSGVHVLRGSASGYAPRQVRVTVPSGLSKLVRLNLQPLESPLAQFFANVNVPDAQLFLNNVLISTTPLGGPIAVRPGHYQLRIERKGYVSFLKDLKLNAAQPINLEAELQPAQSSPHLGRLRLSVTESQAVVSINGRPTLDFANGLALPLGRHHLTVERAGFYPVTRDILVTRQNPELKLELLPEPEYLARYVEAAEQHRFWSWVTIGAGAAVATGGATFLLYNQSKIATARDDFDALEAMISSTQSMTCTGKQCDKVNELEHDIVSLTDREVWGVAALGVGAVTAGAGIWLLLTGDDPKRYEPRPESDVFGSLRVRMGLGGAQVAGSF